MVLFGRGVTKHVFANVRSDILSRRCHDVQASSETWLRQLRCRFVRQRVKLSRPAIATVEASLPMGRIIMARDARSLPPTVSLTLASALWGIATVISKSILASVPPITFLVIQLV